MEKEKNEPVKLSCLAREHIPDRLRTDFYFDFTKHLFAHSRMFDASPAVTGVLDSIDEYAANWISENAGKIQGQGHGSAISESAFPCHGRFNVILGEGACFKPAFVVGGVEKGWTLYVGAGTKVLGCNIYLDQGDIWIGENNVIEPGAGIRGPAIIGAGNAIRQGAYLRGGVVIGNNSVFRGELKNTVVMDNCEFPHPSYLGDSICGYRTHFGNQATTANLGISSAVLGKKNIVVTLDNVSYDLGRAKVGIVLGDYSQVGCNSVSDPGVFLGPSTIVYQLSRINKGFYGPGEVLKNKPMENKVIERSALNLPR